MSTILGPLESIVRFGTLLKIQMNEVDGLREKNLMVAKEFDHSEILRRIHAEGSFKTEDVMRRLVELLIGEGYVIDVEVSCLELGEKGRVSEAIQVAKRTELNQQVKILLDLREVIKRSTYITGVREGTLCVMDTSVGRTLGEVMIIIKGVSGLEEIITLDLLGPPTTFFPTNLEETLTDHYRRIVNQHYPDEHLTLTVKVNRSNLAQAEDTLVMKESYYG